MTSLSPIFAWCCLALAGCSPSGPSPGDGSPAGGDAAHAEDLEGRRIDPLAAAREEITVLVFARRDCPISNRYAPTLRTLDEEFSSQGVEFYLVYPDARTTADEIRAHLQEYEYGIQAVRDPHHALVERAGARVTPEAAVFNAAGELVYRGRIDDRFVDFGQARAQATTHDLKDAIEATLAGESVPAPVTDAVGCYIADLP